MDFRYFSVLGILLLLSVGFFAISSSEALDFVSKQNSFLLNSESASLLPSVPISSGSSDFWVVAIVSSDSVVTFVPINTDSALISDKVIEKRNLIETAYVLRNLVPFVDSQGDAWVSSSVFSQFYSDLSIDLSNSIFSFENVKSELEKNELSSLAKDVDVIVSSLKNLASSSSKIASFSVDLKTFETSFFYTPDVNQLSDLKEDYDLIFDYVIKLDSDFVSLKSKIDLLKQGIASSALSVSDKTSLQSLASLPTKSNRIPSQKSFVVSSSDFIDSLFSSAVSKSEFLVSNLESRILRNSAYQEMFGYNEVLFNNTKEKFSSLQQSYSTIMDPNYEFYWVNQKAVNELKNNWAKANSFFENSKYNLASEYALDSIDNVLDISKDGFVSSEIEQDFSVIYYLVGLGVGLILIIFLFKKFKSKKKSDKENSGNEDYSLRGNVYG